MTTRKPKAKAKIGAPTRYDPAVHPIEIIKLGKEGKSVAQMAAAFDVGRASFYDWSEKHPEFSNAFTRAKEHSQAWWEEQAAANIDNKNFNANLFRVSAQARFKEDYTQTTKQEVTTKNADTPQDPRSVARALMTVLGKEGLEAIGLGAQEDEDGAPEAPETVASSDDTRNTSKMH